jgi:hypothetical protein
MKTLKFRKHNLLYILLMCVGCVEPNVKQTTPQYTIATGAKIKIIEIDSCEYIFYEGACGMAIAHKGNCKYCTERVKANAR